MGKLPKVAKIGSIHTLKKGGRMMKFKRVKASGFGCWKIVK